MSEGISLAIVNEHLELASSSVKYARTTKLSTQIFLSICVLLRDNHLVGTEKSGDFINRKQLKTLKHIHPKNFLPLASLAYKGDACDKLLCEASEEEYTTVPRSYARLHDCLSVEEILGIIRSFPSNDDLNYQYVIFSMVSPNYPWKTFARFGSRGIWMPVDFPPAAKRLTFWSDDMRT